MAARFSSVEGVALELFDEFAEFGRETVHGTLEARQEVERHDDGEADRRDGRQEILFHLASSSQMAGGLSRTGLALGSQTERMAERGGESVWDGGRQASSCSSTVRTMAFWKAVGRAPLTTRAFLATTLSAHF